MISSSHLPRLQIFNLGFSNTLNVEPVAYYLCTGTQINVLTHIPFHVVVVALPRSPPPNNPPSLPNLPRCPNLNFSSAHPSTCR